MKKSASPQERIAVESSRVGRATFVAGCRAILDGSRLDEGLILVLGGPAAQSVLQGAEGGIEGYWPRVWAARGLLHCYESSAEDALKAALKDESWRVREMALKAISRNKVVDVIEDVLKLRTDQVLRVRKAAERAVQILGAEIS